MARDEYDGDFYKKVRASLSLIKKNDQVGAICFSEGRKNGCFLKSLVVSDRLIVERPENEAMSVALKVSNDSASFKKGMNYLFFAFVFIVFIDFLIFFIERKK